MLRIIILIMIFFRIIEDDPSLPLASATSVSSDMMAAGDLFPRLQEGPLAREKIESPGWAQEHLQLASSRVQRRCGSKVA